MVGEKMKREQFLSILERKGIINKSNFLKIDVSKNRKKGSFMIETRNIAKKTRPLEKSLQKIRNEISSFFAAIH